MGLLESSVQSGRAGSAVNELTAKLSKKCEVVVDMESKLVAQASAMDSRVDAMRSEAQIQRVGLE